MSSILIGSLNLEYQLMYLNMTLHAKQQNFSSKAVENTF